MINLIHLIVKENATNHLALRIYFKCKWTFRFTDVFSPADCSLSVNRRNLYCIQIELGFRFMILCILDHKSATYYYPQSYQRSKYNVGGYSDKMTFSLYWKTPKSCKSCFPEILFRQTHTIGLVTCDPILPLDWGRSLVLPATVGLWSPRSCPQLCPPPRARSTAGKQGTLSQAGGRLSRTAWHCATVMCKAVVCHPSRIHEFVQKAGGFTYYDALWVNTLVLPRGTRHIMSLCTLGPYLEINLDTVKICWCYLFQSLMYGYESNWLEQ